MNGISDMADTLAIERSAPKLPDSTYEMIAASAAIHAKAPALSFFLRVRDHGEPTTWNYESFFAGITATANFFHSLGVRKDDVVAFVLPNVPETHFTIWGGQAAGIVFAINPMLQPAAIGDLLRAGGAKVLVTLAPSAENDLWSRLQAVVSGLPGLQHLVLVDPAAHLPRPVTGDASCAAQDLGLGTTHIAVHDFAASVLAQPGDRLVSGRQIAPDDLSSFFCTGGTTGAPKIAMHTHRNEVTNTWSLGESLGNGIAEGRTLFCGLPLFHVNAVFVTGLLPFSRGAHVLLGTPQGYRAEGLFPRFWEIVERHRVNFFSGVPTVYAALLQQPIDGRDVGSLEYGLCGAAPMPSELMRSFQQSTGLKILEGYGLTEGTAVSTVNPSRGERRLDSIGLRLPLQAMKAVVLDDGGSYVRDCETEEVGVLVIHGPNVFMGYKDASHDKGLWVDAGGGQRWLNTGDLGRQDAQGYFYLTGRRKELIIRGGHNIDPATIEQPLYEHPAVQIAAAVGRPDAHAGEVPVAYVQLRPGTEATEAELMNFVKERISERVAMPKAIRIIPAMPLTGVGKIFKPDLKHLEIESALSEALAGAGVVFETLRAMSSPSHGTVVELGLARGIDPKPAEAVLGQFPFRIRLLGGG